MTKRRRFTADFKAKVALEALRGDKTIQEIAGRYKVHPNQVSTWKRQAMDGYRGLVYPAYSPPHCFSRNPHSRFLRPILRSTSAATWPNYSVWPHLFLVELLSGNARPGKPAVWPDCNRQAAVWP